jgi:2-methylcitrate dehydratase PrpD
MLSVIPAAVYGYASTAAFALLKSGAEATSADITTSPLLNIAASLAIGAVFGYVSEKIAKAVSA